MLFMPLGLIDLGDNLTRPVNKKPCMWAPLLLYDCIKPAENTIRLSGINRGFLGGLSYPNNKDQEANDVYLL